MNFRHWCIFTNTSYIHHRYMYLQLQKEHIHTQKKHTHTLIYLRESFTWHSSKAMGYKWRSRRPTQNRLDFQLSCWTQNVHICTCTMYLYTQHISLLLFLHFLRLCSLPEAYTAQKQRKVKTTKKKPSSAKINDCSNLAVLSVLQVRVHPAIAYANAF